MPPPLEVTLPRDFVARLRHRAQELGFSTLGIAPAARPDSFSQFQDWLRAGFAGEMGYLSRREAAYEDPTRVLAGVRSVIMCAMNYGPDRQQRDAAQGKIAAYAQNPTDYHEVLRERLKDLSQMLHDAYPGGRSRTVIDTAPLLERDFARRAGIGWFGKNTMLINKHFGSYFFLGAILTDVALPPDAPHETAHCGTCTRCLEACPTDAFPAPGVLNATRCLSYLTIELRDQAIPRPLREQMQGWMFGCDICQEVCPWNRKSPDADPAVWGEVSEIPSAEAAEFLSLTEEEFARRFGRTPFARPGRSGMARNAALVLGNTRDPQWLDALIAALADASPLVRGAAAWAIGQLQQGQGATVLRSSLPMENDEAVRAEIEAALLALQGV